MKTSISFGRVLVGGVVCVAIAFAVNQSAEARGFGGGGGGGHSFGGRSMGSGHAVSGRSVGHRTVNNHVVNHNHNPGNKGVHRPGNNVVHRPHPRPHHHPHIRIPIIPWVGCSTCAGIGVSVPDSIQILLPADQPAPVNYVLNGVEYTLQPGEVQTIPVDDWVVDFDRGANAGEASYTLVEGLYKFKYTDAGLELFASQQ